MPVLLLLFVTRCCNAAVSLPVRLSDLYAALKEAEESKNYQSVCAMVSSAVSLSCVGKCTS
jgi:hypothetical protein